MPRPSYRQFGVTPTEGPGARSTHPRCSSFLDGNATAFNCDPQRGLLHILPGQHKRLIRRAFQGEVTDGESQPATPTAVRIDALRVGNRRRSRIIPSELAPGIACADRTHLVVECARVHATAPRLVLGRCRTRWFIRSHEPLGEEREIGRSQWSRAYAAPRTPGRRIRSLRMNDDTATA